MTDHAVRIMISKDGAHDFVSESEHDLGDVGAFQKRVVRRRIGIARHMVIRIEVSSPIKRDLLAATIDVEGE